MNINEKLLKIQTDLKCNKNQYNEFGNYHYRSCEDILEAVKPLLKENKMTMIIRDNIKNIGDRYYIEAEVTLLDLEDPTSSIYNTAYAREALTKPKMDDSQITGTASSYARKYALNGLFLIDDTKDADTNEYNKTNSIEEINIEAKVGFGKYKDLTWFQLYSENPKYFDWLIENAKSEDGRKTYKQILEKIEEHFVEIPELGN